MDDLISRQAAIDAVEAITWYHQNRNNEMVSGANSELHQEWYKADDIYAALDNVPTAEKRGKWIVHKSPDEYHCGLVECPFCRTELIAEPNEYCFCPNCGARMEE